MAQTPFDGHPMQHAEYPELVHITRAFENVPRHGRVYYMHCNMEIPLLAMVPTVIKPTRSRTTALPPRPCDECVWKHLAAIQNLA